MLVVGLLAARGAGPGESGRAAGGGRHDRVSRRLPISVRPAHQETVTSYVRRLAELHALPYKNLWHHLSAPPRYGRTSHRRRLIVSDRLAAATGRPLAELERALPELRDPAPDWRALRHLSQRACPDCTARHPGGPVVRFFAHHEFVCTRHGYWIGPPLPARPDLQPRRLARPVPELVTAQRQHTRLLRRYEWQHVFNAFDISTDADRPADHDMPIGYQPDPQQHDEQVDLHELISALTDSAN